MIERSFPLEAPEGRKTPKDCQSSDPRAPTRAELWIAIILGLATIALLACTHSEIGIPRDESVYFRAAENYAAWYVDVWDALKKGHPTSAFSNQAIARRFDYNHEHPVLAKTLFGLSHLLFTEKLHWLDDIGGFRLPAWLFSGLLSTLLFLMTSRLVSKRAGFFAVLAFWLVPRQFFHGHIACFDMPMASAWLAVVYCYWRSISNRRWTVATGLAFGVALATKHNAWIIPGVLFIHFLMTNRSIPRSGARAISGEQTALDVLNTNHAGNALPFSLRHLLETFGIMLVLGPIVFLLHWPYLWHAPIARFSWYFAFHTQHINYPWEYFGRLLVEPPFPFGYAFTLTALTVPVPLLLLMFGGVVFEIGAVARKAKNEIGAILTKHSSLNSSCFGFGKLQLKSWLSQRFISSSDSILILGNALASLTVLSMPDVPIFGGVKHWLPSMPFLLLLSAKALERAAATVSNVVPHAKNFAFLALAALVCMPCFLGVRASHPYETSFYNELAGGFSGAANLGMHRQYWSHNVVGVLEWINKNAPKNARIFFHEVTWESFFRYKKSGQIRSDLNYSPNIEGSEIAIYQYMPEFRDIEFQIWTIYKTQKPVYGLYLDETPQIVVYKRER